MPKSKLSLLLNTRIAPVVCVGVLICATPLAIGQFVGPPVLGAGYTRQAAQSPPSPMWLASWLPDVAQSQPGLEFQGRSAGELFGRTAAPNGKAVFGIASSGEGFAFGAQFESNSSDGIGVLGVAN